MIFEVERTKGSRIKLRVRREPRPDAEVKLADARRAIHDVRLVLYHNDNSYKRGADAAEAILKAAQETQA